MAELDWSRYKNFSRKEFACKCPCNRADMDPGFMDDLQVIRTMCNFPFIITSGFRCPEHNAKESPKTGLTGPHTTGLAVDIAIQGVRALKLIERATNTGFGGLGVFQKGDHSGRFIHIDKVKDGPRPTVWSY